MKVFTQLPCYCPRRIKPSCCSPGPSSPSWSSGLLAATVMLRNLPMGHSSCSELMRGLFCLPAGAGPGPDPALVSSTPSLHVALLSTRTSCGCHSTRPSVLHTCFSRSCSEHSPSLPLARVSCRILFHRCLAFRDCFPASLLLSPLECGLGEHRDLGFVVCAQHPTWSASSGQVSTS